MLVLRKLVMTTWKAIGNPRFVDSLTGVSISSGLKLSMNPTSQVLLATMVKRQASRTGAHSTLNAILNSTCAARSVYLLLSWIYSWKRRAFVDRSRELILEPGTCILVKIWHMWACATKALVVMVTE